ncbi:hypothetical protein [Dongia sp.]|uniref:hypothetical protein n=1 Tax=Dongia sp. TaxID=1977262 RepID=UPI0035AEC9CD
MGTRQKDEQRALDIVAGRGEAGDDAGKPAKSGLGGMELAGIALWLLVLIGGGAGVAYYFLLAPK